MIFSRDTMEYFSKVLLYFWSMCLSRIDTAWLAGIRMFLDHCAELRQLRPQPFPTREFLANDRAPRPSARPAHSVCPRTGCPALGAPALCSTQPLAWCQLLRSVVAAELHHGRTTSAAASSVQERRKQGSVSRLRGKVLLGSRPRLHVMSPVCRQPISSARRALCLPACMFSMLSRSAHAAA